MVEQYPAAFDPVARCNEFIWHTLPAPAVVLRRCLRILKTAAYAQWVELAADAVPLENVRRHLPDPFAAYEDARFNAVRLFLYVPRAMTTHTDDPLSSACHRLDLPEDLA